MEIKSSLVNHEDFKLVKDSLIKASEVDGKEKFRVKMLEYINDSADNDDDEFFYDMLEFVRFIYPKTNAAGYTTPDHLIWLNPPIGGDFNIGENVRKWEFIYDHECMHQLWDTFGVEDKIKKEGIKFDHYVLNIASDVVINDYLDRIRHKEVPEGVWLPKNLKEQYNIDYDKKTDTQYTLYLKLIEVADKLKKDEKFQQNNNQQQSGEGQSGEGQSEGGQSGNNSSSSNNQQQNKTAEDAQKSADEAKQAAKEAQDAADKAKKNGDKDADEKQKSADEAKQAAKEAQDAADKAKEAKKDEDKEGEEKAAKEAQDAANKAKQANNKAQGKNSKEDNKEKSNNADQQDDNEGNPNGNGEGTGDDKNIESDVNTDELKKRAEEIIEKYKRKISGDLGDFLKKCVASQNLKEDGIVTKTDKGISLWNQQLNGYVKAYVKNKVFKKQREFKRTYQKVKRGSGFVEFGQPLQRGKKLKDDKLVISVAFYVDRSGSMTGTIDNVFDAAYVIAESLKKQFGKEKVVGGVNFRMFTFDDKIEEIQWGKKVQARGGNLSMHQYMAKLEELTGDYMINVFITDGQFEINKSEIEKMLKRLGGCLIYVTNQGDATMESISKENKTQLFYIEADSEFKIK